MGPEGVPEVKFTIGKPIQVNVVFTNVGKSIAYDVKIHCHLLFGQQMNLLKAESLDVDKGMHGSPIPPDGFEVCTPTSMIDPYSRESAFLDANKIIPWDGSVPVVVFGRAIYRDHSKHVYCVPFIQERIPSTWANLYSYTPSSGIVTVDSLCPIGEP